MSTPRGLAFDTESKDAWSVSMATPQSEEQVNVVDQLVEDSGESSADQSYSSLSNAEQSDISRMEQEEDMKGELISQRFVVKQEEDNDNCHRTPLTVSYSSVVEYFTAHSIVQLEKLT